MAVAGRWTWACLGWALDLAVLGLGAGLGNAKGQAGRLPSVAYSCLRLPIVAFGYLGADGSKEVPSSWGKLSTAL
jgi:hypothetical protein